MNAKPDLIHHADGKARCFWPGVDPLYVAYHDTDWGVPETDDRALFEKLILDGFQAGLSWITILRKRENFRQALDGFEPAIIARYGPEKLEAPDAGRRHRAQSRQDRRARAFSPRLSRDPGDSRASPAMSGASSTASRCRPIRAAARTSLPRPRRARRCRRI